MKNLWLALGVILFFVFFPIHPLLSAQREYLCFEAIEDSSTISFNVIGSNTSYFNSFFLISYDTTIWTNVNIYTDTIMLSHAGDKVFFKATDTKPTLSVYRLVGGDLSAVAALNFCMSGSINASGDIMSLIDPYFTATELSTSAIGCFCGLFKNCSSLVSAPLLSSSALSAFCYYSMFEGCTNLIEAPIINAYSLNAHCCERMFYGCTSLRQAPILYANNLESMCFKEMFASCRSLSSITVLFDDWRTALDATKDWMYEVPINKGNFICPSSLYVEFGNSNIPTNWTVSNYKSDYLRVVALESCSAGIVLLSGTPPIDISLKYSLNGGLQWKTYKIGEMIDLLPNDSVCWTATYPLKTINSIDFVHNLYVTPSGNVFIRDITSPLASVRGNINYLLDPLGKKITLESEYCFQKFFEAATYQFDNLLLPAISLSPYCYRSLFSECPFLNVMPDLPARNLAQGCYMEMFAGCHSLSQLKTLPANQLSYRCYALMFNKCDKIQSIPNNFLPATTLEKECYYMMFANCYNLIEMPKLIATDLAEGCYMSMFEFDTALVRLAQLPAIYVPKKAYADMFSGCKSIQTVQSLPATHLEDSCYADMFGNCTGLVNCDFPINADTAKPFSCFRMFYKCYNLQQGPKLNSVVLSECCYAEMFYQCRALTSAPDLPAPMLASRCYERMFYGCISIEIMRVNFTEWISNATKDWVNTGMIETMGVFHCPIWLEKKSGNDFIPMNWEIKTDKVIIYDNADNSSLFHLAHTTHSTIDTLEIHRTFSGNGKYDILCLPFSIIPSTWSNPTLNPLYGAELYSFKNSYLKGDTLTLDIEPENHIIAGHPYLIRWNDVPEIINNPIFVNISIEKENITVDDYLSTEHLHIIGNITPTNKSIDNEYEDVLFFEDGQVQGNLSMLEEKTSLRAFRAYVHIVTNIPISHVTLIPNNVQSHLMSVNYSHSNKKIRRNSQVYIFSDSVLYDMLGRSVR